MRTAFILLILAVMGAGSGCKKTEPPKVPTSTAATIPMTAAEIVQEQAVVAEIEKAGGCVTRVVYPPNGPVTGVDFMNPNVPNEVLDHLKELKHLDSLSLSFTGLTDERLKHLEGLNNLQTLFLQNPEITDAGLVHLRGLVQLNHLDLGSTKISDAGLEHLVGLNHLQILGLNETSVTETGLVRLKKLNELKALYLRNTKVTDEGVKRLTDAPPTWVIVRW